MKKYFAAFATLGILTFGATHTFGATTTPLDCRAAGTDDVYNTPSGHVDPGYYDPVLKMGAPTDATSGKPSIVATITGTRQFEICTDAQKTSYEYPITPAQLSSFEATAQPLPAKVI